MTVAVSPGALPVSTAISPGSWPALVLNADYRPLSYYPLSLWSWQDTIKAVFLDRVTVVSTYEKAIHSPSFEMRLPSVVSLKTYVKPSRNPAFTRFNVFLRDRFRCQYCGHGEDLTFDHLVPRSKGGQTTWDNVLTACVLSLLKLLRVHDVSELPPAKLASKSFWRSRNQHQLELRVREVAQ